MTQIMGHPNYGAHAEGRQPSVAMSHAQRIRELREYLGMGRQAFADATGIKKKTLEHLELGQQAVYAWHLESISRIWPEYSHWLLTGNTLETSGQIRPGMTWNP